MVTLLFIFGLSFRVRRRAHAVAVLDLEDPEAEPLAVVERVLEMLDQRGLLLTRACLREPLAEELHQRLALIDWQRGQDIDDENINGTTTTEARPSVHGDVLHSRPVAINYGPTSALVAEVRPSPLARQSRLPRFRIPDQRPAPASIDPRYPTCRSA